MIDTHAHLNFEKFEPDVKAVLSRAKEKGVKKLIVPSSNLRTSKRAIELAEKYPEVFAAIGLHPVHAKEMSIENLQQFYTFLSVSKVVAVGEMGLDYFYLDKTAKRAKYADKKEQEIVFTEMLKLAQDTRLPLILHCRKAYEDLLRILINEGIKGPGVIHCFMGNKNQAKSFLNLGFNISFTGNITYSSSLDSVVKSVPLDSLLLETDCPFLAPEPHRGKRNEPAYIIEIAKKIAEIKKISLIQLEQETDKNAEKLFKLKT